MGWSYGRLPNGKEVGYSVEATCEQPGCGVAIDRGLDFACGGAHGVDEFSCDRYFCSSHLICLPHPYGHAGADERYPSAFMLCQECEKQLEIAYPGIEDL